MRFSPGQPNFRRGGEGEKAPAVRQALRVCADGSAGRASSPQDLMPNWFSMAERTMMTSSRFRPSSSQRVPAASPRSPARIARTMSVTS